MNWLEKLLKSPLKVKLALSFLTTIIVLLLIFVPGLWQGTLIVLAGLAVINLVLHSVATVVSYFWE